MVVLQTLGWVNSDVNRCEKEEEGPGNNGGKGQAYKY